MSSDASPVIPTQPEVALSLVEARVLGCLIEKELTTPDVYPLTLNSLVNACNQRSNRDPVMDVMASEAEAALTGLRAKRLVTLFSGADARVAKYRQTLDLVFPMAVGTRALFCELLIRGPQTTAELRLRAERMQEMPLEEAETVLQELAVRPAGALVRRLARQPGQKEARWAQLLTGEPVAQYAAMIESPAGPSAPAVPPAPALESRVVALEAEVEKLRGELDALRRSLGGG
jgi:uncharacterized protein YceH (UPF0502 family)